MEAIYLLIGTLVGGGVGFYFGYRKGTKLLGAAKEKLKELEEAINRVKGGGK